MIGDLPNFSLLVHGIFEMKMAQFHPIIVHFPIAFFIAAVVCDLLYAYGKQGAFRFGHWMVICATVMTGPAILTGLQAAKNFDPNDIYVHTHMLMGYASGVSGLIYSAIRILAMKNKLVFPPKIYVAISLVVAALISWGSDYGGLITRGTTPFNSRADVLEKQVAIPKDAKEVLTYSPEQLQGYFQKQIALADVVPIFSEYKCAQCHEGNFSGGHPKNFSVDSNPDFIFLPRNEDGSLKDFENSPFYITVILKNKMPITEDKHNHGLPPGVRLTLLQWLLNGAPGA